MFPDNDMATNIVRWMKTKIHGYKPFTVMPNDLGDNRLSDTEVLLRQSNFASEESFPPHLNPRRSTVSLSKENIKSNGDAGKQSLNLGELECDVSVEGCSPDQIPGQRQEFSFTLYDLDGHGKITKDDIAGLVKTIYETLGQSIKVPHYGSKTIKVKLTVSPEKKTCKSSEETTSSPTLTKSREVPGYHPGSSNRWSNDLNYLKSRERRYRQQEQKFRRRHSISSSGLSEDREADVSEDDDDDEVPLNNKLDNANFIAACRTNIYSRYKKRSSSLQRQELLQIIQANMEKNNLCFQTSRKHAVNNTYLASHYRQRPKAQPVSRHYVNSWEYPLQSSENCNNMFLHSTELKNLDTRQIHQRSRSYDLPNNRCSLNDEKKKQQPTSHELKHRYRELEQARAKEQVVRWLEQEFSSPTKYSNNRKNNNNLNNNSKTTSKEEVKSKSRSCSNEKHEHHHIHEHVHHHYHHYHEAPIVV